MFADLYGVHQGRVLYSRLFCVHVHIDDATDVLTTSLRQSGYGSCTQCLYSGYFVLTMLFCYFVVVIYRAEISQPVR